MCTARSCTRFAIEPGKRWIAGRSRKTGSRSADASVSASIEPSRSFRSSGPANAFCTVICWSSTNPTSSAIGSLAISRLASSESVKWSWSGMSAILPAAPRRLVAMPIADATYSAAGGGERLWFLGTLATVRLPAEASGGRFALIEGLFPHLASPPLHTHPQDETYVALEGRMTLVAGERRFELGPGDAGTAPSGVAHTFRIDSETARVLIRSTPAGLERMMRDA